jgi:hypothetical protein
MSVEVKQTESYALKFCSLCYGFYTLECTSFNDTSYCSDLCIYCLVAYITQQSSTDSRTLIFIPEIREAIRKESKQTRERDLQLKSESESHIPLEYRRRHSPEKVRAEMIKMAQWKFGGNHHF